VELELDLAPELAVALGQDLAGRAAVAVEAARMVRVPALEPELGQVAA